MYRARIGPFEFTLCHAAVATAPAMEGPVVGFVDEIPIRSVALGRERYLVIDHRTDPAAEPVAYIEWWRPASGGETPPTWLLALTAASGPPPSTTASAARRTDQPRVLRSWPRPSRENQGTIQDRPIDGAEFSSTA